MEKKKLVRAKNVIKDLDKVLLGVFIYSLIGHSITEKAYKNIEKPESFGQYQELSNEISFLNNAKERANSLKNSKNYYISNLDWNVSKLEKELSLVEEEKYKLEKSSEFISFRKEQKDKGKVESLFFFPLWLSLTYGVIRMGLERPLNIYEKNEENEK